MQRNTAGICPSQRAPQTGSCVLRPSGVRGYGRQDRATAPWPDVGPLFLGQPEARCKDPLPDGLAHRDIGIPAGHRVARVGCFAFWVVGSPHGERIAMTPGLEPAALPRMGPLDKRCTWPRSKLYHQRWWQDAASIQPTDRGMDPKIVCLAPGRRMPLSNACDGRGHGSGAEAVPYGDDGLRGSTQPEQPPPGHSARRVRR
jgi:hypothetical protein